MRLFCLTLCLIFTIPVSSALDCGTLNGVSLPCWRDYLRFNEGDESLPYYPYAKRPNGCSLLNQQPGLSDLFVVKGETYNFRSACNGHDRCYYTPGSDRKTCGSNFLNEMRLICQSSGTDESQHWCLKRANLFFNAVDKSSFSVHRYSQRQEAKYLKRAEEYLLNAPKD